MITKITDFFYNHKKLSVALIVALVILLIVEMGFIWLLDKLDKITYDPGTLPTGEWDGTLPPEETTLPWLPEQTDPSQTDGTTEVTEPKPTEPPFIEYEVVFSKLPVASNGNVTNILLLGTDEREPGFSRNARADSIMILSLNKNTNQISLVSLERAMGFPIMSGRYKGQYDWFTHHFAYGGADMMMKEIQEYLRIEISRYARVNFSSFEQVINTCGGVDIELTEAEVKALNEERGYTLTPGVNRLSGIQALHYARLRKIDSDWQRVKRQRNVISALISQAKQMNLLELNAAADQLLPLVQTNLTTSEILELLIAAPGLLGNDIQQKTLPVSGSYGQKWGMEGRVVLGLNFDKNARALRDMLYK